MKNILKKIPLLPLSALIFYLTVLLFWKLGIAPSPIEILTFLENLYTKYGIIGLFIASFLEGIVYLGLYFPGSFIIVLAVILSDGTIKAFLIISLTVALAITLTSIINYFLGQNITHKKQKEKKGLDKRIVSKGFLLSMLHPNSLAFYFFNSGIKNQNPLKIILVPLIMIPYGFITAVLIYLAKESFEKVVESPYILITIIIMWIIIAFLVGIKKRTNLNNISS